MTDFIRFLIQKLNKSIKQEALNLPQHKLIVSVATRWGSTYDMVARIIEQQQAICAVLAEDRKNWHRMPSDTDISVLETVYMVLKPLSTLTDALSGEKQVTILAIRPVLKHVQDSLTITTADRALATQMKTAISTDLQRRNNSPELGHLIDKASFLDPRFRDQYLENKDGTIDCESRVSPPCHILWSELRTVVCYTSSTTEDSFRGYTCGTYSQILACEMSKVWKSAAFPFPPC